MSNSKLDFDKGYTLIQLIIFLLFISILAIAITFVCNLFHNKNSLDEEAILEIKTAIIKTQKRAKKERNPYSITLKSQNNFGTVQYSIHKKGEQPNSWKDIINSPNTFTDNQEINFNSQGNLEVTGQKIVLNFNKQKKCLVLQEPLEKMKYRVGAECN